MSEDAGHDRCHSLVPHEEWGVAIVQPNVRSARKDVSGAQPAQGSLMPTSATPQGHRQLSGAAPPEPSRFAPGDRATLLLVPGIGPLVLKRLEQLGITSIAEIQRRGVDQVVVDVNRELGVRGWGNRARPLQRALRALAEEVRSVLEQNSGSR